MEQVRRLSVFILRFGATLRRLLPERFTALWKGLVPGLVPTLTDRDAANMPLQRSVAFGSLWTPAAERRHKVRLRSEMARNTFGRNALH